MNAIKINATFAAELEAIRAANKTPWVIINEDYAVGTYSGRTQARDAKAAENLAGKIMKADEVTFEVVEPVKEEPVTLGAPLTNPEEMANQPATEKPVKPAKTKVEITHESTIERPCKRVFIIADEMLETHPGAKRKDVLAACVRSGIAYYTARTQYQQWLQVRKEMAEREAKQAK